MAGDGVCVDFVSPYVDDRVLVYDVLVGLPALVFLLFLCWHFRTSVQKLRQSGSQIMTTYFTFLCGVTVVNIVRCMVQIAPTQGETTLWNVLWLVTKFGTNLLEISVVVFLLQGYAASGRQALVRTLFISGCLAALETLIKIVYIAGFHVPLFLYDPRGLNQDMMWSKWSFWLLHHLVFGLVYLVILLIPCTQWRERLPAKASFYRYVSILFFYSVTAVLGCILIGSMVQAGYCVYGVAQFLYYAGYPPLLYWTFLSEFFADEGLDLEVLYYAEMRDAGYFEDDEDDMYRRP